MFRALCAHHQEDKFILYSIWYHHTETRKWSKITKLHFYKYKHIVVKFMYEFFWCDYFILLTGNMSYRGQQNVKIFDARPLTCFSVMIPDAA